MRITDVYFDWLCSFILDSKKQHKGMKYFELLSYLHSRDFEYILELDGNRAEDGINLRYRFGSELGYSDHTIATYLYGKCSVLEMMVALAIRCETHIMDNPEIGDRTSEWFWGMITNLGIRAMSDEYFDEARVEKTINKLLNREYGINGEEGLFTIKHTGRDIRKVDIWYQMCWYLRENCKGE